MRVLDRVERSGAYADLALNAALVRSGLSGRDRALATELVYGTLRWRGRLDHLLDAVVTRGMANIEPGVATVLRLGAYQIVFADRIPTSAAVDESVHCARAAGLGRATGLVNASLRRLAVSHGDIALPVLADDPLAHLMYALSMPAWIAERLLGIFEPEEARAFAEASNAVPPIDLRANRLRNSAQELLEEVRTRFPDACLGEHAPDAVRLGHGGHPGLDPAFRQGRCTVQDQASQLVVELLDPQPDERVLDVCAAPGAKTTAIAERVGRDGGVLALDRNTRRLGLVARDARRLALSQVRTHALDATRAFAIPLPGEGFDRVLVDVPCSGIGTLRRNPDLRWRLRPGDPARLATIQAAILDNAASVLRPGGALVYSTCTLLPEENEAVVRAFLKRRAEFRLAPPQALPARVARYADEEGFVRTLPHRHDVDAFTSVRLERTP